MKNIIGRETPIFIIQDNVSYLKELVGMEDKGEKKRTVILDGEMSKSISSFMSLVKEKQGFPEYFGKNWDAYNDSLRDVLWKTSADHDMYILIITNMERFLIDEASENIAIFIRTLNDAIKELEEDKVTMIVKVIFVKSVDQNTAIENELKIGNYSHLKYPVNNPV